MMQHDMKKLFHIVWLCHIIKWSSYNKRKKNQQKCDGEGDEQSCVVWERSRKLW